MADVAALERLIEPEVEKLGFALVRVKMTSGEDGPVLQVMAEREDTRQLTIDDCGTISRAISVVLDQEDPIPGAYRLEVSSPGIDRPLTRLKDFGDWAGHEARINLVEPVEGKKQLRGKLVAQAGEAITIDVPQKGETVVDFKNIHAAKLLLTDRLIKESAPIDPTGADVTEED